MSEHASRLGCNLYDAAIVPEYGDAELKTGKFASGSTVPQEKRAVLEEALEREPGQTQRRPHSGGRLAEGQWEARGNADKKNRPRFFGM